MQQQKPVDVVVAGGGFVGLTLAKEITTRTSLKVLVLERGQPRKLSDYVTGMDELDQPWRRKPVSLAQVVGRPVTGWEEEKD